MPDSQYIDILFINEYTGDKGACDGCAAAVSSCGESGKTDYIELYNDSDGAINLEGFQFQANTEEDGVLYYTLGDYTIEPKGLLFLCANEGDSGLNTNFSIKKVNFR